LLRRQKTAGSSYLQRKFTALSISGRSHDGEAHDEIRGPDGLTVLHEPAEPLIDFVFVHGLRGGSRKTWSKSPNPAHFWPKEWLPLESSFRNVRILTFGYNSDWGEIKGSSVTIHDFGQALLAELYNSPCTGGSENDTPIVFVAHSMGGIVVKKVLILAKQDPNYSRMAARIHTMIFLATPHRGAPSAQRLGNVLQLSGGSKSYVENLIPNSEAIHTINDQFRHVYQSVKLWSFFETVKTSLGLIVEKDSAILGLPGERIQLLNADHRHVCKFEDPSDPNYISLRNAFASTVTSIENTWFSVRRDEQQAEMKKLTNYLGGVERPDSDLAILQDGQVEGSCLWLTEKSSFHTWREGLDQTPNIFWLRGDPATGKSIATGHVARYLNDCNIECSIFFFRHNITGKSTVADLLCSLAWQMAFSNSYIRKKLLSMQDDGITLDRNNPLMLWRTIFLARIFPTELRQPHFWIIDALDESTDCAILCSLLAKVDRGTKLRVFLSSRPDLTIERIFSQEKIATIIETTSLDTTLEDIRTYLDLHADHLPVDSEEEREDLVSQIVGKSSGNFLWTTLVVKELEQAVTQERISQILRSVPKGIDDLYLRILSTITSKNHDANVVARAILRWVVCAARPLSVDELREALILDIHETVPQLDKNAGTICGYLVYVDKAGLIHTTHQTVKDYLFRKRTSDDFGFALDRLEEHARIAEICLSYLCSDAMKTIRYRRTNMSTNAPVRSAFTDYVILYFSGHLSRASSANDGNLIALNKFFLTNSLTWFELIAAKNDLGPLTETAKNLKAFLKRRAKYRSPLGKEVRNILEWTDDIIRLVAQFGRALSSTPSAIHFLIPSVCPADSIIFRNFGRYPRPLQLVGLSQKGWSDRLCCIPSPSCQALCVATNNNKFVVGFDDGTVHIYHEKTFQEILKLAHGEPVRCLAFTHVNGLLASAGRRKVNLWDLSSEIPLWTAAVEDQTMAFDFTEDDSMLMAATRDNKLTFWQTRTGARTHFQSFSDFDEEKSEPYHYQRPPIHIDFSPGLGLLGVAYRTRPVSFFDLETCEFRGQYHKTGAIYPEPFIHDFIFNPVPEICLAAVAFQDGDIAVFDPWSSNTHAMIHCDSSCLAASPNGTILASGSAEGVIKLFDFETLKLLYQIGSHEENIRCISFGSNGLRFYDVRSDHCNVWEPSVLVRRIDNSGDDSSVDPSDAVESDATYTNARVFDEEEEITALTAHHDGDFVFCGHENGTIRVFSTARGKPVQHLNIHPEKIPISILCWNDKLGLLAAADRTGRTFVHQLQRLSGSKEPFVIKQKILECTASSPVRQMLLDNHGKRMLVANSERTEVWDLENGEIAGETICGEFQETCFWLTHPQQPTKLLCVLANGEVQAHTWTNIAAMEKKQTLSEGPKVAVGRLITFVSSTPLASRSICTLGTCAEQGGEPILSVYSSRDFGSDKDSILPAALYKDIAKAIKIVIGCYKSLLVFLDHSDWVCSLDVENLRQNKTYTKHFFVPKQWQGSGMGTMLMLVTKRGSVVLVSMDEIAVFHSGLDFEEKMDVSHQSSALPAGSSSALPKRPAFHKGISSPI
jgi:WD40 repeat protein